MFTLLTTLNGVLFLAWVTMMFRTLLAQRQRVKERTGRSFPSLADSLGEWRHWWRSDAMKFERRLLIGLSVALILTLVAMPVLAA